MPHCTKSSLFLLTPPIALLRSYTLFIHLLTVIRYQFVFSFTILPSPNMSLRQTLAVLAILLTAGSAVPTSSSTTETSSTFPHLNELAQAKGKLWFGSSIDTTSDSVDDETYMSIFNKYEIFGQTTPGNTMKWQYTEPENGEFDFSLGEETVTLAKKSDKKIRCHNLVWTSQLPSWVSDGSWTKETLLEVMKTHITKEITYYGSNCYSWDVVNEAIEYDGSYTDNGK